MFGRQRWAMWHSPKKTFDPPAMMDVGGREGEQNRLARDRADIIEEEKPMRCQRCHGCMISDHFMDILNVSGEMDFKGWRCLNCGDITDAIILSHHQVGTCAPPKSKRRWWGVTLIHSGS